MLDRRSKNIIWIFLIAITVIFLVEVLRPRPLNWGPSFTDTDQIPFGCFVLYQELPGLLQTKVEAIEQDPFEFILDSNYASPSTYLFINNDLYFDQQQVNELLEYTSQGNTLFLSARDFGYILEDTLSTFTYVEYDFKETQISARLLNPGLSPDSVTTYQKGIYPAVIDQIDSAKVTSLGHYRFDQDQDQDYLYDDQLNFVRYSFGKGQIYLHTLPEAFTNYYLLKDKLHYPASVLSYIETPVVYWDTHMKSGRREVPSQMRFIFAQESLTWAYYLSVIGILFIILFKAKREQRPIPVIEPLRNTSVEFTQTIGDLYFQHKDYESIIAQRITYLMETIRNRYQLDTRQLDNAFIDKLAGKSGSKREEVERLIKQIRSLQGNARKTEAELIKLNKNIDALQL